MITTVPEERARYLAQWRGKRLDAVLITRGSFVEGDDHCPVVPFVYASESRPTRREGLCFRWERLTAGAKSP